ncbi:MAG: hypothetical protein Q4B91_03365 [Atopobiaceae bacterium]|nr:hypothetical protein [Atopobiaceae bacterium]
MTVGRALRRVGWGTMCCSVCLASVWGDSWAASFLLGTFLLGVGLGLRDGPTLRDALAWIWPPREG